jgi:succinate dehydrogenase / fumarate reductase membrane anchor subunit
MSKNNIGANRLVVGAHYGLTEWLLQRVTAVIMVIFTILFLAVYLVYGNASYEGWSS